MNESITLDDGNLTDFPKHYQYRPHLCKEFHRMVSTTSDTEVLLLEARPGIGASSICTEYFNTIQESKILLQLHTGSRAGYSLPYLLDQALQQGYALLGDRPKQNSPDNQTGEWHNVLTRLQRRARAARQKLYLVVDGLYQIPSDDERYLVDVIRNVLALGNRDIRHVLTWTDAPDLPAFLTKTQVRRVPIPPLSHQEAKDLLIAAEIEPSWVNEILSATNGVPAMLTSIVRLQALGKLERKHLHLDLSDIYNLEWNALIEDKRSNKEHVERVFAFLVFSKRPLKIAELPSLAGVPPIELDAVKRGSGFVKIDERGAAIFSSNTHREFLKRKLEFLRLEVLTTFVERLTDQASTSDSIQLLPNYFEDLGRDSDIVNLLTPENLDIFLAQTQSLTALRRRNELGFRAARRVHTEVEAYRFSLQTSIVRSLEAHDGNNARLAALASVGRLDTALDIAQRATTKEARLFLLSQYAKILYEKGLHVDTVIADDINSISNEIDFSADRERAYEIAENIVGPFPELGISIIEQTAQGVRAYQDAGFSRLALKAQVGPNNGSSDTSETYAARVTDSKLQDFLRAAETVIRRKSAAEIKNATAKLDGWQRSFLLQQWVKANVGHESALEIADFALDEVVRDRTYLPSAADLRDLCLPIAEAKDRSEAVDLLWRIDAHRSALLNATNSVDKFRLDLEIARAKSSLGIISHDDALSEMYIHATDQQDNGVKLECLSWIQASLADFPGIPESVKDEITTISSQALQDVMKKCFDTTADHLSVFRGAISALVETSPPSIFPIIEQINTESRRDSAYSYFIKKLIGKRSKSPIQISILLQALAAIKDEAAQWEATVSCLRLLAMHQPELDGSPRAIIYKGISLSDPLGRAHSWRWALTVSQHYSVPFDLPEAWDRFSKDLDGIDDSWLRPDLTYWFIETLSNIDKAFAEKCLSAYDASATNQNLVSPQYAQLIASLGRLAVVSFAGVLDCKQEIDEELRSVLSVIDQIPSLVRRVDLLTDLALRAHAKKRHVVFETICDQNIIKLIQGSSDVPKHVINLISACAYPALYLRNQQYAESLIADFSSRRKDSCRLDAISYLITYCLPYEPNQDSKHKSSRISYIAGMTIVSLIEKLEEDACLGGAIEMFACAATSKASISEIPSHQRIEFSATLTKKAQNSLPDQKNIKHEGWLVYCMAYCLKLGGETRIEKWKSLIDQAKNIPNSSDLVYVLSTIAECLPSKFIPERESLIKDAELVLNTIPSHIDRVRRRIELSNISSSSDMDSVVAKRLLSAALTETFSIKDSDAALDSTKRIVDAAYQLDPDFAAELLKSLDNDPARIAARAETRARIEAQRNKGAMIDQQYDKLGDEIEDMGRIAWELLGSLNANKITARNLEEMAELLSAASRKGIFEVLGFYWWYLRNFQHKYEHNQNQGRAVLIPLFEVTRLACLLAIRIGKRIIGAECVELLDTISANDTSLVSGPGQRIEAIDFIKAWLTDCDSNDIIICDPYFDPDQLDFVKELSFHRADLSFKIISCTTEGIPNINLDSEYRSAWSKISHMQLPDLRAVHVSYAGNRGKHIIHDRWLLCGTRGLRIGTSINSVGLSKLSEISKMNADEVLSVRQAIDPFIQMSERWIDGLRLSYNVVQW